MHAHNVSYASCFVGAEGPQCTEATEPASALSGTAAAAVQIHASSVAKCAGPLLQPPAQASACVATGCPLQAALPDAARSAQMAEENSVLKKAVQIQHRQLQVPHWGRPHTATVA
jgi:hypothetical protein